MQEDNAPSPEYIKAFNQGYQLQKHEPELMSKILATDNSNNENMQVFIAGRKQYQKELLVKEQQQITAKQKQQNKPKL